MEALSVRDYRNNLAASFDKADNGGITYSRRISANNRIIYRIHDDEVYVLVVELERHYDDK